MLQKYTFKTVGEKQPEQPTVKTQRIRCEGDRGKKGDYRGLLGVGVEKHFSTVEEQNKLN